MMNIFREAESRPHDMFIFQGTRDIMHAVLMEKIKSPKEKSFVGSESLLSSSTKPISAKKVCYLVTN
jgi:hypothetical protein